MKAPPCRYLRSKILFVPEQLAESEGDDFEAAAARQCWCNKTMTPLGLDDRRVNWGDCCDPTRECYRPS